MFTSKAFLHKKFDVDPEIAAFFVDREVPANNKYWNNRLLYVSAGTGYLFIPLYFDLQRRCGLASDVLLSATYVGLNEQILHDAAREEAGETGAADHITFCRDIVKDRLTQPVIFQELNAYFGSGLNQLGNLGTGIRALNRADTLLYALCTIPADEMVIRDVIACWYALVPSFLLIDDIIDLQEDIETKQENSVLEFGKGKKGIIEAVAFLKSKIAVLQHFNPAIGNLFEEMLQKKIVTSHIKAIMESES